MAVPGIKLQVLVLGRDAGGEIAKAIAEAQRLQDVSDRALVSTENPTVKTALEKLGSMDRAAVVSVRPECAVPAGGAADGSPGRRDRRGGCPVRVRHLVRCALL